MKMRLNFKCLTLITLIFIVTNGGESKNIAPLDTRQDAFNATTGIAADASVNSTEAHAKEEVSQPSLRSSSLMVRHIRRRDKRETAPDIPFDFHTNHLPCDLDQRGRSRFIDKYPNHCIWVWNNRYVHEGFYRVYKTYQLEAFTFAQYMERITRYEVEIHSWQYQEVDMSK